MMEDVILGWEDLFSRRLVKYPLLLEIAKAARHMEDIFTIEKRVSFHRRHG